MSLHSPLLKSFSKLPASSNCFTRDCQRVSKRCPLLFLIGKFRCKSNFLIFATCLIWFLGDENLFEDFLTSEGDQQELDYDAFVLASNLEIRSPSPHVTIFSTFTVLKNKLATVACSKSP